MKTPRNIITGLFGAALATIVAFTPIAFAAPEPGFSTAPGASLSIEAGIESDTSTQAQAKAQAATPAAQPKFDGRKVYREVFQHLRDKHIALQDQAVRTKWVTEWEKKFDNDGTLDTEDGANRAVLEMLRSIGQRFDSYNLPEANKREQESVDATLVGIGVPIQMKGLLQSLRALPENATEEQIKEAQTATEDRQIYIPEEPFPGGPAAKGGLKEGDRITHVEGVSVNGKTLNEVVEKIRGKEGTAVKLTVERSDGAGNTTSHDFNLTRARVTAPVVKFRDLGDGVSYIALKDFMSRFAEKEMADALKKAAAGKAVIIDLRGNGGGRLDAVETMAEYLLPEGTVLTIKQRQGNNMVENRSVLQPAYILNEMSNSAQPGNLRIGTIQREDLIIPANMPMIVIVDEGSASASEILSGLLQANGRAVVVGKTTLGKGVGQAVVPISFDRNIHVTTFEFLPGGKAMDWVGIIPDIEVDQPEDDALDPKKDTQLDRALQAAKDAVAARDALDKKREETRKENEELWEKRMKQLQGNTP